MGPFSFHEKHDNVFSILKLASRFTRFSERHLGKKVIILKFTSRKI